MAMGRRRTTGQGEFWIPTDTLRKAPGHPFFERLNAVLDEADFDRFCETPCQKFYAAKLGRPSVAPGVYFRMLMIGYFEKLDSERQIAWRCDDSRSLRAFLGIAENRPTPDHSNLSRTRQRINLADEMTELGIELNQGFNVGTVELHQVPSDELNRFLDLNTARLVYGKPPSTVDA